MKVLCTEAPQGSTQFPSIWTVVPEVLVDNFGLVCMQIWNGFVNSVESDSRLDVQQRQPEDDVLTVSLLPETLVPVELVNRVQTAYLKQIFANMYMHGKIVRFQVDSGASNMVTFCQ